MSNLDGDEQKFTGSFGLNNLPAPIHGLRQLAQPHIDVILTPTLVLPPIEHGKIAMTGTSPAVLDGILEFMPCTQMANWTGQPRPGPPGGCDMADVVTIANEATVSSPIVVLLIKILLSNSIASQKVKERITVMRQMVRERATKKQKNPAALPAQSHNQRIHPSIPYRRSGLSRLRIA